MRALHGTFILLYSTVRLGRDRDRVRDLPFNLAVLASQDYRPTLFLMAYWHTVPEAFFAWRCRGARPPSFSPNFLKARVMIANFLKNRFFAAAIVVVGLAVTAAPDCSAQRLSNIESQLARRLARGEISGEELTRSQQSRIAPTAFEIARRATLVANTRVNQAREAFIFTPSRATREILEEATERAALQDNRFNYLIHQIIFEAPRPQSRQRSVRRLVERSFTNQPSQFRRIFGRFRFAEDGYRTVLLERNASGQVANGGFAEVVLAVVSITGFDASLLNFAEIELTRPRTPQEIEDANGPFGFDSQLAEPPFLPAEVDRVIPFLEDVLGEF